MAVRTVIVGCGFVAPLHAHGARDARDMVFTGACDRERGRAEELAGRFDIACVYSRWDDVLADETVDAVDLCVPHHLHYPYVMAALHAGKHVLVEKPLATTLAHAREMAATAARLGRVLMPVHNRVFMPALQRLKEIVDGGALGEVYLIKTLGVEPPDIPASRSWLNEHHISGGGVTMAQTVHFAYLCRWLMGDVRSVGCLHGRRMLPAMDDEDTAIILLQFASGSIGEMTSTFAQGVGGYEHRVTLYGSGGLASASNHGLRVTSAALYGDAEPHDEFLLDRPDHVAEFGAVLDAFARAIVRGDSPAITAEDGIRAVEIIEAAARAARDRRIVDLPLPVDRWSSSVSADS